MSNKKPLRKQLFVDPKVQGALVLRTISYWGLYILTIVLMLLCWRIVTGPARMFYTHFGDMWFHFGPALVASALLLPLILLDMIRITNRFAGPMLRMRRSLRALARGEHVDPIRFRDGDFWQGLADEFNALVERVQGDGSGDANRSDSAAPEVEAGVEPATAGAE